MTDEAMLRSWVAGVTATTVSLLAVVAAIVLGVHVAFVVLDADAGDGAVRLFGRLAGRLAPGAAGLADLVPGQDPKLRAAVAYAVVAGLYLVAGQLVSRLIRRAG